MTRYGMAVDTNRCVACGNCGMACKVANNLPDGVRWNTPRTDGGDFIFCPGGTYPDKLEMTYFTLSCQHCSQPACLAACPTGATSQTEDGIVLVDQETCIGCKSCIQACPYEGVRVLNDENPTYLLDFAVGDYDAAAQVPNTVGKCTFCSHRLARGERPACADICRYGARYFGDLDDPDSDISKILKEREYDLLMEDQGTGPNFFYLK